MVTTPSGTERKCIYPPCVMPALERSSFCDHHNGLLVFLAWYNASMQAQAVREAATRKLVVPGRA